MVFHDVLPDSFPGHQPDSPLRAAGDDTDPEPYRRAPGLCITGADARAAFPVVRHGSIVDRIGSVTPLTWIKATMAPQCSDTSHGTPNLGWTDVDATENRTAVVCPCARAGVAGPRAGFPGVGRHGYRRPVPHREGRHRPSPAGRTNLLPARISPGIAAHGLSADLGWLWSATLDRSFVPAAPDDPVVALCCGLGRPRPDRSETSPSAEICPRACLSGAPRSCAAPCHDPQSWTRSPK